ncbi:signal-transducing adaptor protein 1-like [Diretmus argenteus]
MPVPPSVVYKRRTTITALPLYYSGHLLKKRSREKDFKKYYGELRGSTVFLYKDDTQDTYTEKLDLEALESMALDSPYQRKKPTIFTLYLDTEEVQLKMDNPDTGEEWRGFIMTVAKKEIPSGLHLLPGQLFSLQEVLVQEQRRQAPKAPPTPPPRPDFLPLPSPASPLSPKDTDKGSVSKMPSCFYDVTRQEAEMMLRENPEYGSIIIRPSNRASGYAVTLQQISPSGPVLKNYRVTVTNSGFLIELQTAVTVPSLNEVLNYFLNKTEYRLYPFVKSQPYDTLIAASNAVAAVPWIRKASSSLSHLEQPSTKAPENDYLVPDDVNPKPEIGVAHVEKALKTALRIQSGYVNSGNSQEEITI